MRIAFVSFETIHHREREVDVRMNQLVEDLVERTHDVHVCCAQWWPGRVGRIERDGVTYHGVSVGTESRRGFLLRLPVVLRSIDPDIVHTTALPPAQVQAAKVGARSTRAPMLTEFYGEGDLGDQWWSGRAVTVPDKLVTPSRLVRTWVRERGANGADVSIVPTGVDLDRIRSISPTAEPDVVYARRLDESANLESLLLGLAELRSHDWEAIVIGDGPARADYERQAQDFRIDDRITFAGELTLEERLGIYRGAHAFVQTARRCVFPTELLWALASGCVGIVEYHANSSAHELVEGRTRGFRTTSEQELADAILTAGDLERRDVDEDFASFDRTAVLERYLQFYRDLQDERGLL